MACKPIAKVWADKLQSQFEAVFGAKQDARFLHLPQPFSTKRDWRKKRAKWGSGLPFTTFAIGSCIAAIMGWVSVAMAAEDVRFTVTVPLTEASSGWKSEINDGMGLVLDRVLLQRERHRVRLKGARYLVRATPAKTKVRFQFRASAVIAALQRRGLHPIALQPQIKLQLSMRDAKRLPMPQTVALLQKEADTIANRWGIQWDQSSVKHDKIMTVKLKWQWVDERWLSLTVEADDASLVALGGENPVDSEQPMAQLRNRLDRIVLRARDVAAASQSADVNIVAPPVAMAPEYKTVISIMHSATLSEQVGLEQVLQAVAEVKRVTPLLLGHQQQRYQLLLTDEQWIATWFANRGMHATMTADGWVVQ